MIEYKVIILFMLAFTYDTPLLCKKSRRARASTSVSYTHLDVYKRQVLKGLTSVIGISVVHWHMDEKGWRFLPYNESNKTDGKESYKPSAGLKCEKDLCVSADVDNHSIKYGICLLYTSRCV